MLKISLSLSLSFSISLYFSIISLSFSLSFSLPLSLDLSLSIYLSIYLSPSLLILTNSARASTYRWREIFPLATVYVLLEKPELRPILWTLICGIWFWIAKLFLSFTVSVGLSVRPSLTPSSLGTFATYFTWPVFAFIIVFHLKYFFAIFKLLL